MLTLTLAALLTQCPPPTGTLTIVPGAGMTNSLGQTLPLVRWAITCPPQGGACPNATRLTLGDIRTEFAANPTERPLVGSGTGYPDATLGEGVLPGLSQTLVGANVQVSVLAGCNNRGSEARLTSAPVAFAATLVSADSRSVLLRTGTSVTDTRPFDQVPVGAAVHLTAGFEVLPSTTEDVTVRIEGAGITFSRAYRRTSSGADSVMRAYRDDATANVTATATGPIRLWLEYAGTRSPEALFTAVPAGSTGAGGGTAQTGGGAGSLSGGTAGGATMPRGGCSSMPGLLPLLAAWVLATRRRRG